MNLKTQGNVLQRKVVTHLDGRVRTVHDLSSHLKPLGGQDITLLAIHVVNQGDIGRPVGIILNGRHQTGNTDLITLEINLAAFSLVLTAPAADTDPSPCATAGLETHPFGKGFFRALFGNLLEGEGRGKPEARGSWFISFDSHLFPSPIHLRRRQFFRLS